MTEIIDVEYLSDITANISSEDDINTLSSTYDVLVFSKTTCSFCVEMKRTLISYGVCAAVVEVDQLNLPGFDAILEKLYSMKTFPMLVIDGKCIGGCSDLKAIEHSSLPGLATPLLRFMV